MVVEVAVGIGRPLEWIRARENLIQFGPAVTWRSHLQKPDVTKRAGKPAFRK